MIRLIYILLIALFCSIQFGYSQNYEVDENTVIKDKNGKRIDVESLKNLMDSGDWTVDPKKDDNGNQYMQLRKVFPCEKGEVKEPKKTVTKEITVDENTVIKDKNGKRIDVESYNNLMDSGNWMFDRKKDDNGNQYMQLRKVFPHETVEVKEQKKTIIKKFKVDENIIVKDKNGKRVDVESLKNLMDSGNWTLDRKKDDNGNQYMLLRKASDEEKAMVKEMVKEMVKKHKEEKNRKNSL